MFFFLFFVFLLSHLFITVLHSLTLVCGPINRNWTQLSWNWYGYGRRPKAALITLVFPIVYPFHENIISYFSGPAKARAPKKQQRTTPKGMTRGEKRCRGELGGVRNSHSSDSNKWMSQKRLNAQLFDKICEGASFVAIAWPLGKYLDVVTQRVTRQNNNTRSPWKNIKIIFVSKYSISWISSGEIFNNFVYRSHLPGYEF